jgi:DNA-binding NtrC family response regulator
MRDDGSVLLVDPERDALVTFEQALGDSISGSVVVCTDFTTARKRLLEDPPGLLVTNLRLEAHNGLHLVYLAANLGLGTRCIVYSDHEDAGLMREARSAGAAYESKQRIPQILASYASERPHSSHRGRRHASSRM